MPSPLAAATRCGSRELQEGTLELWSLLLAEVDTAQLDPSPLDERERERAAALAKPDDRNGYLAVHLLLRQLLGRRLGTAPQEIVYSHRPCAVCGGPHGRPELERPRSPLHFSLSRSGGVALIGIAPAPLGVDVEALPELQTVEEVSELLHSGERREIASAAPSSRAAAFARVWARKEAYLKGIGIGVSHDLAADYLGTEGDLAGPDGWSVLDVPVPDGYAAAVAVAAPVAGTR